MAKWIKWEDVGAHGYARFGNGDGSRTLLKATRLQVEGGWIYRIEDDVPRPSGHGGHTYCIEPTYVFVPALKTDAQTDQSTPKVTDGRAVDEPPKTPSDTQETK